MLGGIGYGLYKLTKQTDKGIADGKATRAADQAKIDAGTNGDMKTAEQKDDEQVKDAKETAQDAMDALKTGATIPGTSTAGPVGLKVVDAVTTVAFAIAAAATPSTQTQQSPTPPATATTTSPSPANQYVPVCETNGLTCGAGGLP